MLSYRNLRFRVSEPARLTLVVGTRRYTRVLEEARRRREFWLKTKPASYRLTATDAAGNTADRALPPVRRSPAVVAELELAQDRREERCALDVAPELDAQRRRRLRGVRAAARPRVWLTFTPMPRTTRPELASGSTPTSLRPATTTSFGCRSVASTPVSARSAAATASPATSESSGQSGIGASGRSSTDIRSERPGHVLPAFARAGRGLPSDGRSRPLRPRRRRRRAGAASTRTTRRSGTAVRACR